MSLLDDVETGRDEEGCCVFCGEMRGRFEFEDGLRCVYCAEEDGQAESGGEGR